MTLKTWHNIIVEGIQCPLSRGLFVAVGKGGCLGVRESQSKMIMPLATKALYFPRLGFQITKYTLHLTVYSTIILKQSISTGSTS